ncbi:MAG: hypothetical protein C4519_08725 [Desulfobacteraceae bacterium]|nr:MAG: hypothetical protein C4519_08725 [Desulfobacteraceae bacterium]
MKSMLRLAMALFLALMMVTACSKKSEEQTSRKQSSDQQQALEQQGQAPAVQQQEETPADRQQTQPSGQGRTQTEETPLDKQDQEETPSDQDQAQPEEAPSDQADQQIYEISGTVVTTEEGIAIFSAEGNYLVAGQDLTDLVGKNVTVTGTLEESPGKTIIIISSVSVIE